jgi:hypothetical protein
MDEHLKDIMEIEQVQVIIYFSFDGSVLFQYYKQKDLQKVDSWDMSLFATVLDKIQEAEFVFENAILYIIRGRRGFLLTVLDRFAPVALVRLNCNILLASLDRESHKPKGLSRFF